MRCYQYLGPLAGQGVELDIEPLFGDGYVEALYDGSSRLRATLTAFIRRIGILAGRMRYDALWIEKEALPWVPALLEFAMLPRNMPVIVDYDDAVFHRYDLHRSRLVRTILGRKLDKLMARAELVVAGNDYLADRARRAGCSRVEVVPTVVDLDRYAPTLSRSSQTLTIGWIGSPSTAAYLDDVKPALEQLARRRPLRGVAIGARPDQVAGSCFAAVPWSEDTEIERLREIDIGLMPLKDTPWERGKCGYKLIQFMALGIPVVASPVGVNRKIVQNGENGFLASSLDEWVARIELLTASAQLRSQFGQAGRRLVERDYSLSKWAARSAALFRSIT